MSASRTQDAGLILLGAALPLSIAASNAGLTLVTLGLLLALADNKSRADAASRLKAAAQTPLFAALIVYAAAALIAALAGLGPEKSLPLWRKDLHKLWVVLILCAAFDAHRRILFARGLAAGAAVAAAAGIGQTAAAAAVIVTAQSGWDRDCAHPYLRAHGFTHPVSYGELMCIILLGLLLTGNEFLPRRARLAATLLFAMALVCNQTRTVLVALLAALALVAALQPRWRRAFIASLFIGAGALWSWEFMYDARSLASLFAEGVKSSQAVRVTLWRAGLQIFRDHPWTGVGPGHYRTVFASYSSGVVLDGERDWGSAHNIFIHQAAERGLVGLLALGLVCAVIGVQAWRGWRARRDDWSLWILAVSAAFFVMNLTETAFQTEQVATLFLALTALTATPRTSR